MKKISFALVVAFAVFFAVSSQALADIVTPTIPTDTDQCKNEGWVSYDVFKNQGDCVSYVVTDGSNEPSGGLLE